MIGRVVRIGFEGALVFRGGLLAFAERVVEPRLADEDIGRVGVQCQGAFVPAKGVVAQRVPLPAVPRGTSAVKITEREGQLEVAAIELPRLQVMLLGGGPLQAQLVVFRQPQEQGGRVGLPEPRREQRNQQDQRADEHEAAAPDETQRAVASRLVNVFGVAAVMVYPARQRCRHDGREREQVCRYVERRT